MTQEEKNEECKWKMGKNKFLVFLDGWTDEQFRQYT